MTTAPAMTMTMVSAERAWWEKFLAHPTAAARMFALYGQRYGDFFAFEFRDPGNTIEIGSGPLPVMEIMECEAMLAVDIETYEGLTQWPILTDSREANAGAWDTALLLNVLDHADDPQSLADEALRLLKPSGRCLVFCHFGQAEDDRHRKLDLSDITELFGDGWGLERYQVYQPAGDPPAFYGVYRKLASSPATVLRDALRGLDGLDSFLACGSLLVAVRGDGFLPWEYDIDIGVFVFPGDRERILTGMERAGFALWRELGSEEDGMVLQFSRPDTRLIVDVYGFYRDSEHAWMKIYKDGPAGRYVYPVGYFETFRRIYWMGQEVTVPVAPEKILHHHYGPGWRTPRKDWDWASDPLCLIQ